MKYLIIISILFSSCCFAQNDEGKVKYDRVNIYALPVETSFAGDYVDANYTRVKHTYTFSSTDKNYIENSAKYFLTNRDS